MLRNGALPNQSARMQEVDTELKLMHRRRLALNNLIRAVEEYALLSSEADPLAKAKSLAQAMERESGSMPGRKKPTPGYLPLTLGKRLLA
jgi:hypothetical protein